MGTTVSQGTNLTGLVTKKNQCLPNKRLLNSALGLTSSSQAATYQVFLK